MENHFTLSINISRLFKPPTEIIIVNIRTWSWTVSIILSADLLPIFFKTEVVQAAKMKTNVDQKLSRFDPL